MPLDFLFPVPCDYKSVIAQELGPDKTHPMLKLVQI